MEENDQGQELPLWDDNPGNEPPVISEDMFEPEPVVITEEMLTAEPARDSRLDFERNMTMAPRVTIALILVNIAVFVWQLAAGTLESKESIVAAGALVRERVMGAGEGWRLGSSMFLHGSPDHLIGNMIVLYILGMAGEHAYGWRRMLGLYLASGLTGALLSMAFSPGPSVGASGAIFGLMGGVIVFLYRHQKHFFIRDKRIGLVLVVWGLYQIATGFLTPFIDNFAHIGGVLGGAAAGMICKSPLLEARIDALAKAEAKPAAQPERDYRRDCRCP